jgi:L-idonate 5-dehydrogenase
MKFLGSASLFPHVQGMFREHFVMGERQCYPVHADVSLGELAFAEPLAVALHAVNRGGDLLGKSVLITGAGTIGCLTVIAARLAGAARVTVTDVLDRPLEQAREVGADVTLRDRDAGMLASQPGRRVRGFRHPNALKVHCRGQARVGGRAGRKTPP